MRMDANGGKDLLSKLGELIKDNPIVGSRTGDDSRYKKFLDVFPPAQLKELNLEQYCIGSGNKNNFCWWIERGLENVLGRYSPGTSRGHIIYKEKDGEFYLNRHLIDLSNDEALAYTLKIQYEIANADVSSDVSWVDDDSDIYIKAGVSKKVTIGDARKLRLLAIYHPDDFIPITSSDHLGHFLNLFGLKKADIPDKNKPVARSKKLFEIYEKAKNKFNAKLTPYDFMCALYSDELNIRPMKESKNMGDNNGEEDFSVNEKSKVEKSVNQILYGPPGTGKTYSTVRHALEILGEKDSSIEGIQQLKDKFPGQVEFVTFHQSFSYEDFVEGLKADIVDGQISYDVKPGVFKEICSDASSKGMRDSSTERIDSNAVIWKMSLGASKTKDAAIYFEEAQESNSLVLGWGGMADFTKCKDKGDIYSLCEDGGASFVTDFIFGMKEGDIVIISDGNYKFKAIAKVTGPYCYDEGSDLPQKRGIEWLQIFSESRPVLEISEKNFTQSTINKPKHIKQGRLEECLINESVIRNDKPYVLIIDEINRGNISRIFGELITLIEPTKREGEKEAISIQLPYSKTSFSVPSNLYIIGTMNTADRSLALMDTALRRRFDFIEMLPNHDLLLDNLDGVNLQKMLKVMNQRIEALYDREHMIGHSFLMHLKNVKDLNHAFNNKILPLLEEYFYDDWQKIKLVLADSSDLFYEEVSYGPDLFKGMENETEQKESYRRASSSDIKKDAFIRIYKSSSEVDEGSS